MSNTTLYLDPSWRSERPEVSAGISIADRVDMETVLRRAKSVAKATKYLRRFAPEAAAMMASVGGIMATRESLFSLDLNPGFGEALPAFRSVIFSGDDKADDDTVLPIAMTCSRVEAPVNVQPTNLPVYRVIPVYEVGRHMAASRAHISIAPGGTCKMLKELVQVPQRVGRYGSVVHMKWRYPDFCCEFMERRHISTMDEVAAQLLGLMSHCSIPEDAITVRVFAGGGCSTVAVGKNDATRIFAGRELLDEKRRKIFHYAVGHYRESPKGEIFVRPHYRGARKFRWKGIRAHLSVPNWHHASMDAFRAAAVEEIPGVDLGDSYVEVNRAAKWLGKGMDQDYFL